LAALGSAVAKVGGNAFLSRVLGFVRDLVLARVFGADAGTDAFFVAFKVPNFARRLFAEGAFAAAFVPVFFEYKANRGQAELRRLLDEVTGTLGALLAAVTILGVLAAPLLILVFAPGFGAQPGQQALAAEMLRLTLPYLLFISLTALAGGVLNAHGRFGVPAFTPVLLNVSIIACALHLAPALERPVFGLAWGVLIGGILQLAFQLPPLARLGLIPRPRFNLRGAGVTRIVRRLGPGLFGVSVTQVNLLLDTLFASFLAAGSISWLYYSDRLMEFPLGILAVALGTVILPRLSREHARRSPASFSDTLDWALRWTLLLGAPAAVGLTVLAGPILATLFYSAEFAAGDVRMASLSLMAYAVGLAAFMAIKVLVPGYYARNAQRAPVRFALVALAVNLALNLVLMGPLGHAGLALATSVAAFVNAALLLRGLLRAGVLRPPRGWPLLLLRGLGASLAMAVLLWFGTGEVSQWLALQPAQRVLRLGGWIVAGALVYALTLLALGIRPRHLREHVASPGATGAHPENNRKGL
jgi:putative peptidoglycan lipid II flippase